MQTLWPRAIALFHALTAKLVSKPVSTSASTQEATQEPRSGRLSIVAMALLLTPVLMLAPTLGHASESLSVWQQLPYADGIQRLLQQEWASLHRVGAELIAAWGLLLGGIPEGERLTVIMRTGLPLLLLMPLRWLSRGLTAIIAQQLNKLHNQLVSGDIRQRGARAGARFLTAITPLVPWLALLWLTRLLPDLDADQYGLGGTLPLLYTVYVIYKLVDLSLEWFLLSVCQGNGTFLNAENTQLLERRANRVSSWLLLPWVIITVSEYLLHSTLVSQVIGALVWLFSWLLLSYLLHFYREALVNNLKRLTPESADRFFQPMAQGVITVLILPILVPVNLLLLAQGFFGQLMGEFAWYQRLSARWFHMKNQTGENDEDGEPNERTDDNYLKWFEPYGDEDFPIINTGLSDAINKYFSVWSQQPSDDNVLLLAGEPGIGKKSAVRRFCQETAQNNDALRVTMLDIPARTLDVTVLYSLVGQQLGIDLSEGPAALATANEQLPPTLLVVNNAEHLFLADVGGLEAWEALLSLTNSRAGNVFWLLVINNQSWAYLCNVFGRDYQMRNVIQVKRWAQAEIRSMILSRNQQSGYRLRYDDVLMDTRGPTNGAMRNAEQRYFSLLWDASWGVPAAALKLWQASVTTRGKAVTVRVPRMPSGARIEKSGPNQLFVFAAIVTHGSLTTQEIVRVTNMSENVVRFALKSALEDNVVQKGEDSRYRITTLWYHTVVNILNRMNMLHE